ncbi:Metallo-dependent phosphatase [Cylindrobasidium torrendii FP15055 ss-10]|uniref:Metallo-dependent phosphatase n=1 Tax=Cylindrobasidium torrendii FP15055 ss-10 TaxID=1314674 RepID=A0A0D7AYL2_9AGAR|nr:Metallo-dependent phosphatase [Cylindrobasidium torrendii FP15055 ss-10]
MQESSRIYTNPDNLPPHPGNGWTRFVCISDTHSRNTYIIPDGDVLIHAGDLTGYGMASEVYDVMNWIKSQMHEIKLVIAGNHDLTLDRHCDEVDGWPEYIADCEKLHVWLAEGSVREAGLVYLENESTTIQLASGKAWRVYGTPISPMHKYKGAFQYAEGKAEEMYAGVPDDVEILLTHGPPYGTLDKTKKGKLAGCEALAKKMEVLTACRLHVFGHIHEAWGAKNVDGRVAVNAACPISKRAIVVDIKH